MYQFTIIIPTNSRYSPPVFNKLSVLNFPVNSFEVIIVANGTDIHQLKKSYQKYSKRKIQIRFLYSNKQGASAARNIGIRSAKYPFLIFVDDDIELHPNFLNGYVNAWHTTPTATLIGGSISISMEKYATLSQEQIELAMKHRWCFSDQNYGNTVKELQLPHEYLFSANFSMKKSAKLFFNEALGSMNDDFTHIGAEDYELCFRISLSGKKIVWNPNKDIAVKHIVSKKRFSSSYVCSRYRLAGSELRMMEKILKSQFKHFKNFYLPSLFTLHSIVDHIKNPVKLQMLYSYITWRNNPSLIQ